MYNIKINNDGSYRDFFGYTIICMTKDDLSFIEEFLKNSYLSKYYSPLPAHTYHMTVFNIWSYYSPFLPTHKKMIENVYGKEIGSTLIKNKFVNAKEWYDPLKYYQKLLMNLDPICKKYDWENLKGKGNLNAHSTIQLSLILDDDNNYKICEFRKECSKLCEHDDRKLVAHLTLGYRYKDIPNDETEYEKLNKDFDKLSQIVNNLEIEFKPPEPYRFDSMKNYIQESNFWF